MVSSLGTIITVLTIAGIVLTATANILKALDGRKNRRK